MPAENEVIPADAVAAAVVAAYREPATATLIRRGFNDTYEVLRPSGRAVARVYLAGKYYLRGDDDIRFELDLLEHLDREGVSVSVPLRRSDGDLLGWITDAAGMARPVALFTWAEGEPVAASDKTPEIARGYGRLVGSIHAAAATFTSKHSRYRLDGEYLLEQPTRLLRGLMGDAAFRPYERVVDQMRAFLAAQPLHAPAFGYVHGDPHGRNVHVDDQGRLTAFDFDHGGFGWRAYDAVTAGSGLDEARHDDFVAGYRSAHPLPQDLASLRPWAPVRSLWDVGDFLAMAPVMGKGRPSAEQCAQFLDQVTEQWRGLGRHHRDSL